MSRKTWFWFPRICAAAPLTAVGIQLWTSSRLWAFPEAARRTRSACVACHTNPAGGGDLTAALIHPGSEAMCRQCHTPVLSPDFDFAEYVKRGTH